MKKLPLLLAGVLILPWLSIPFFGKRSLKKYLLSVLCLHVLIMGEAAIAKKRVWWWYFRKFNSKMTGETALVWGPFFVSSLWILKFTYGKFFSYFTINFIIDNIYTYFIMDLFKRMGFAALIRLKRHQLSMLFIIKSLVLYGLQMLSDKFKRAIVNQSSESTD